MKKCEVKHCQEARSRKFKRLCDKHGKINKESTDIQHHPDYRMWRAKVEKAGKLKALQGPKRVTDFIKYIEDFYATNRDAEGNLTYRDPYNSEAREWNIAIFKKVLEGDCGESN